MWPWFVPLAVIQLSMGVLLWRHIQADRAVEPDAEEIPESDDHADDPDSVMIYTNPVAITVTRHHPDDKAILVVRRGNRQFEYETTASGAADMPWIDRVRQGIGWRGAYLFVRNGDEGRYRRRWMDAVLKLQDGRLIEVGVLARDSQESAQTLGPAYGNGCFHDQVDMFNGEVGGYDSKGVGWPVALREVRGRFVVDLKRTWAENQKTLKTNEADGTRLVLEGDPDGLLSDALMARFGENVLIAAYCGRTNDAVKAWQRARQVLQPADRKRLVDMEKRILPGEVPCYGRQ